MLDKMIENLTKYYTVTHFDSSNYHKNSALCKIKQLRKNYTVNSSRQSFSCGMDGNL